MSVVIKKLALHVDTYEFHASWWKSLRTTCITSCLVRLFTYSWHVKQGVALTGRNRTGPPCIVGRPTADAPGGWRADWPASLQTTADDRRQRQTSASKTILAH